LSKEKQDQINKANNKVVLHALSPSSGIAFFEEGTRIFEMNGSSGQVEECERNMALQSLLMEYGLEPVEREFDTRKALEEYVKKEYWREKKDAYYTLLLTNPLNPSLRRKIINTLNRADFRQIPFSSQTVAELESRVREQPQLLSEFLQEVEEAQAIHVRHCLMFELPDVLEQILELLINQAIRGNSDEREAALDSLALEPLFQLLVDKANNIDKVSDLKVGINAHVYEILYRMYEQDLYRYLLKLSRNPDVAKDIASETWIKVAESLYSLKEKSPRVFKSWLLTIARNTWLDRIRRPVEVPTEETDLQSLIDTVRSIHNDILDRLAKEEEKERLREAIQALPEKEHTVICLHYYEGMTFKEIAKVMGRSLRSMDNYKRRGLKSLEKKLQNTQQEGGE